MSLRPEIVAVQERTVRQWVSLPTTMSNQAYSIWTQMETRLIASKHKFNPQNLNLKTNLFYYVLKKINKKKSK